MKHLLLLSLFALLVYGLSGCGSKGPDKKAGKPNTVSFIEGIIVTPINLTQTITVPGTLKPFDETVLMPEITGRVVQVNIPEGKAVARGTLLVKLSDNDLQAQLGKVQAQVQIAEAMEKRQAELLKMNGISQSEYDQAALQVNSVKADLDVLKAQIRKTEIIAPFDGVVGLRNISVGAEVTPGTALTTLRASHRLKVDFSVPEKYSSQIKTGMAVRFTVQGEEKPHDAQVLATEQGIEASTRALKVRAIESGRNGTLVPGAFVTVEVSLAGNPKALMVPTQAIIPKEREKSVIVCRNGKAIMVPVKTGIRQTSSIEIISGLSAGDTVATTGILFIKPGMALTFSKLTK